MWTNKMSNNIVPFLNVRKKAQQTQRNIKFGYFFYLYVHHLDVMFWTWADNTYTTIHFSLSWLWRGYQFFCFISTISHRLVILQKVVQIYNVYVLTDHCTVQSISNIIKRTLFIILFACVHYNTCVTDRACNHSVPIFKNTLL